jgi:poly(3-hydroxybutyrate) depolymerase
VGDLHSVKENEESIVGISASQRTDAARRATSLRCGRPATHLPRTLVRGGVLALIVFAALVPAVRAQGVAGPASVVNVPAGPLMARNPIVPKSQLIARQAVIDGVERTWYEYVPPAYAKSAGVALVVAFHGGNGNPVQMFNTTSWAQIADEAGFIVIYPQGSIGTAGHFRWNAYPEFNHEPGMALSSDNGVDEAHFVKELVERVEKEYGKIDAGRVFAHGQSNGGMMSSYVALRFPRTFAAVASSSAPPSIEVMAKYPVNAVLPMYFWSGENDTLAGQYNPAHKTRATLCREFAQFWAGINKTALKPQLRLDGPYNTLIYAGEAEVRSTEFRNGIHELPFTAAYLIWNEFFSRFARTAGGAIRQVVPDANQAGPADTGAVAIKLGAPFALVDAKVVRLGNAPADEPILAYGTPRAGVLVPASFLAAAYGGTVGYEGQSKLRISTKMGTVEFSVGVQRLSINGEDVPTDVAPQQSTDEIMIPFGTFITSLQGKQLGVRTDVFRNDIYYAGDRSADLSAQTIHFIDAALGGPGAGHAQPAPNDL